MIRNLSFLGCNKTFDHQQRKDTFYGDIIFGRDNSDVRTYTIVFWCRCLDFEGNCIDGAWIEYFKGLLKNFVRAF